MSEASGKDGTVLAFDFGLRYIGVAAGQTITRTARGITTLNAKQGRPRWHEINRLIEEYSPIYLIVGHPLHMDGKTSSMSQQAQEFAQALERRYNIATVLADERLTSFVAQGLVEEGDERNDHEIAARLIAEQYLSGN